MADEEKALPWAKPVEILPDNERTAEIMKKRQEEDEIKRQKQAELKALAEK
jgi:hypothetical protein